LGVRVELQPYIRPVAQITSAGLDEIRWKGPHLDVVLQGQGTIRLTLPRSDLFRHQSSIRLRNSFW